MRVLLTGAGGFTGRYVIDALLERGHEVLGLEFRHVVSRCPMLELDLLGDPAPLVGAMVDFQPTHVLHLAALSHVTASAPGAHYEVNAVGTERLLRVCSVHGRALKRIVLASTANVYGNAPVSPISEMCGVAPANHYAISKLAMEIIATKWFADLPIVIARPFNYTGRGQSDSFLVPKIVAHFASKARTIRLGNLDVSRDISDVRYVAEVYCLLLEAEMAAPVVNICSGRSIPLRQMLTGMRDISGWDVTVEVDPALVRANEIADLRGDATLLHSVIGQVQAPQFRRTLEWMFQGYQR
jgi:GDP-6-deoxy-D-talose 4-dehydrogenase